MGSIPASVVPKTVKMLAIDSLLGTCSCRVGLGVGLGERWGVKPMTTRRGTSAADHFLTGWWVNAEDKFDVFWDVTISFVICFLP